MVKDYHNQSLHHGIAPMILENSPSLSRVAVRLAPGDLRVQLAALESVWKQFLPGRPFEYQFLDEVLDGYYRSEITLAKGVRRFCHAVHLYQLSGNARIDRICYTTTHQRDRHTQSTRCYGGQIILLLTRNFLWLTIIANVIGWPVAYYLMSSWLNDFAYRIELEPLMFIATGLLTLGIVLITVGGQAWRARLRQSS